jgi:poly(3-hydroxybutyrate) depolymerase
LPQQQEIRFADANDLPLTPKITDTPVYTQKEYGVSEDDSAKVIAFKLKKGGHTWPGRDTGDGTSTSFTKANGDTVSHAEFPTNGSSLLRLREK